MHQRPGRIRGLIKRAVESVLRFIVDTQGHDLWRGYR